VLVGVLFLTRKGAKAQRGANRCFILFPVVSELFIHAKGDSMARSNLGAKAHTNGWPSLEEVTLNHSDANGFDIKQSLTQFYQTHWRQLYFPSRLKTAKYK
jgi:hypothetical protein